VRNPLRGWGAGIFAAQRARELLVLRCGGEPLLTRAILFDKRPDANWGLPLHQDLSIAVRERAEAPGFGPWSLKDGVPHVEPPACVLAGMITARLHLDSADERNGCLRFVPGSHLCGRAPADAPAQSLGEAVPLVVEAGDVVLMKPLVLHGSERAVSDSRRRVLHLEFAFVPLPEPLAWASVALGECDAAPCRAG
jgi:hypothetical protein